MDSRNGNPSGPESGFYGVPDEVRKELLSQLLGRTPDEAEEIGDALEARAIEHAQRTGLTERGDPWQHGMLDSLFSFIEQNPFSINVLGESDMASIVARSVAAEAMVQALATLGYLRKTGRAELVDEFLDTLYATPEVASPSRAFMPMAIKDDVIAGIHERMFRLFDVCRAYRQVQKAEREAELDQVETMDRA